MKMKNYFSMAVLATAFAFVACSSDNELAGDTAGSSDTKIWKMQVNAERNANGTRALTINGSNLDASWETTDVITVMNGVSNAGTLQPKTTGVSAVLEGTLTGEYNVGDALTLWWPSNEVSYAGQDGTLSKVSSTYDYSKAEVQVATVDADRNVLTTSAATFVSQQAIGKFSFTDGTNTLAVKELTITADHLSGSPLSITNGNDTKTDPMYIALHNTSGSSEAYTFTVTTTDDKTYKATFNANIADGKYYSNITLTVTEVAPNYEAVDLGLPSGTKWANMNVGASTETEYGDYFAWGETKPKQDYSWSTYKWCNGSSTTLTKYNTDSGYGTDPDNKTDLDPEDDAAHVNMGGTWRMPTAADFHELINNTTAEWVSDYNGSGISGFRFTNKSDASKYIFLPAAGNRGGTALYSQGSRGLYWSSSLTGTPSYNQHLGFFAPSTVSETFYSYRYYGQSVRAVMPKEN